MRARHRRLPAFWDGPGPLHAGDSNPAGGFEPNGDDTWEFAQVDDGPLDTELLMTTEQAWRMLTNNLDTRIHAEPEAWGDDEIIETLLRTRATIGTPK